MSIATDKNRDDLTAKTGMWFFLFTEMLLFGGLFMVCSVYRFRNPVAFHLAAQDLSTTIGTVNTIILLTSSTTIAMAISAIQKENKKLALLFVGLTILLGLAFLVNKYFEWGEHIRRNIYPSSLTLAARGHGDVLFYGLYFFMTGLHALHIIAGLILISTVTVKILKDTIRADRYIFMENSALYWHLVDLVWIFLFPLFYLIT